MTGARLVTHGLLALPLAFAALPIYVHVPALYARTAGLGLEVLGAILLGARLMDAFLDPWLGRWADRLPPTRMLWLGALPLAVGFVALMHPPAAEVPGASGPALWLAGTLALTYIGWSTVTIAYQAWGARIGARDGSQTRLTAVREGWGLIGVIAAAALPGLLVPDRPDGVSVLSPAFPPLLLIGLGALWWSTGGRATQAGVSREHHDGSGHPFERPPSAPPATSLLGPWLRIVSDPVLGRLLLIALLNGIASAIPATLFLLFVADVLRAPAAAPGLLALYFCAGALSLPVWVRVASRWGRPTAWLGAMGVALLSFTGASVLGPSDVGPFAAVCVASGLALGADLSLPAALAADRGARLNQAGTTFGVWNFVAKLNLALAAGLCLPLLAWAGYLPDPAPAPDRPSPPGADALSAAYALIPLGFKTTAALLLWRWRPHLENSP